MLTTGLPLPSQRLSAELLSRAAARAGLQGRLLQRKLDQIPTIALPALLLLKDGRSTVLVGWQGEDEARILLSESDGGEVLIKREALADDYIGKVFFAQPQHKFDVNHGSLIPRARSWFRDTLMRSRWLYTDAIAASFLINIIAMAAPLQIRLMDIAHEAPSLAAASNHAAFNLANALGPWFGGMAITAGYGWTSTGYIGAATALVGLGIYLIARRMKGGH